MKFVTIASERRKIGSRGEKGRRALNLRVASFEEVQPPGILSFLDDVYGSIMIGIQFDSMNSEPHLLLGQAKPTCYDVCRRCWVFLGKLKDFLSIFHSIYACSSRI
ncbi:hypothetical protein EVAR_2246_1 [Eumeta japonica]|uniref:Uncharacterized protein n=1 Tax=Eumeta variegata TaxID=151549 RepID=A0A4C1SHS0_EUMVA|nr:hypothetical protein EVAR_2246_1 [Eumeta japonica]